MPPGTTFVGDQVCGRCHRDKLVPQLKSGMGRAMEPVADSVVLNANRAMTFKNGPYNYEIKRQDRQSIYTVTDGSATVSLPVLYAFGQGKAGQTYVVRYQDAYYESLVSFYKEVGGLDFTIGAPRSVPNSMDKAIGRRLSENDAANCFSCHSTGGVSGSHIDLEKVTPGVRCEACHGPGAAHVTATQSGRPGAKLIFNPNRLSGDEITQEFCASCHRGNDEFTILKSMEINNVRFQPYRIFHSKCYSDDKRISCTACHNPHESLKQDAAYYDAKCLACHETAGIKESQTSQARTPACRVGTKDCVSCHMPRIGPPAAHFMFTDHYIRIVKQQETYPN